MFDLLKKRGNRTIFAAKIKAWNSWMETAQPICGFVVCFFCVFFAKTVFSLDAAHNQFYFGCAVCSSCLNIAYCAITYVFIRTNRFKLHASGRFQ